MLITPLAGRGQLLLQLAPGLDGLVSPALRGTQQRPEFLEVDVEDIAAAGAARQGHLLAARRA